MDSTNSTEDRIKEVAYQLFQERGYAGTRTRDIAGEAGVNLSMLNYYFRSKEKLFNLVMTESIKKLFLLLADVINDNKTTLLEKIDLIVSKYSEVIASNPHLFIFVMGELRRDAKGLMKRADIPQGLLEKSLFYKQLEDQIQKANLTLSPYQIVLNAISMTVLPILSRPIITHLGDFDEVSFELLIEARKLLIPQWIKEMLRIDE